MKRWRTRRQAETSENRRLKRLTRVARWGNFGLGVFALSPLWAIVVVLVGCTVVQTIFNRPDLVLTFDRALVLGLVVVCFVLLYQIHLIRSICRELLMLVSGETQYWTPSKQALDSAEPLDEEPLHVRAASASSVHPSPAPDPHRSGDSKKNARTVPPPARPRDEGISESVKSWWHNRQRQTREEKAAQREEQGDAANLPDDSEKLLQEFLAWKKRQGHESSTTVDGRGPDPS